VFHFLTIDEKASLIFASYKMTEPDYFQIS